MSASWKIASMVILPLSLAGIGCVAPESDDLADDEVALSDASEGETSEATQEFCGTGYGYGGYGYGLGVGNRRFLGGFGFRRGPFLGLPYAGTPYYGLPAYGFGGGATSERKLEIMRDSRLGSYGACAVGLSLLLRWAALTALADPIAVAWALVAAHAAGRAPIPGFMGSLPPARTSGLAVAAGRPSLTVAFVSAALGAVALCPLGLPATLVAVVLLAGWAAALGWLAMRQIAGQTGDVLGALEQGSEVLVLLVAVGSRSA